MITINKYITIAIICLSILTAFSGCVGVDYVIVGDTVYYGNQNFNMSVSPHTLYESGWVDFTFVLYNENYNNTLMDGFWLFNRSDAKPKKTNYTGDFIHLQGNWGKWTDFYAIKEVNVKTNKNYTVSAFVDVPFNSSGKYCFGIKKSSVSWSDAWANGEGNPNGFFWIDPWFDTSYDYNKKMTITNNYDDELHRLIIGYDNSCSLDEDVHLEGHCQNDFDDIRLIRSDNETEIPIFYDTVSNGDYAIIWFTNSYNDDNLYLYYGNDEATRNSQPEDVFWVWLDWTSGNVSGFSSYQRLDAGKKGLSWEKDLSFPAKSGFQSVMSIEFSLEDFSNYGNMHNVIFEERNYAYATDNGINLRFGNDYDNILPEVADTNDMAHCFSTDEGGTPNHVRDIPVITNVESVSLRSHVQYLYDGYVDVYLYKYDYDELQLLDTSNSILSQGDIDGIDLTVGAGQTSGTNTITYDTDHLELFGDYDKWVQLDIYWIGLGNYTANDTSFSFGEQVNISRCDCLITNPSIIDDSTGVNLSVNLSADINAVCLGEDCGNGCSLEEINISLWCQSCGLVNYTFVSDVGKPYHIYLNVSNLSQLTTYFWNISVECQHSGISSYNYTNYSFTTKASGGGCDCDDIRDIVRSELNNYNALKESDNIEIELSMNIIGLLTVAFLLVLAYWRKDFVLCLVGTGISLAVGVGFLGYALFSVGWWLGIGLFLLAIYFSFLALFYGVSRAYFDNLYK